MTKEQILLRLLSRISNEFDKSVGSFFYDVDKPLSEELETLSTRVEQILKNGFALTAVGTFLDSKVAEQGIVRKAATSSFVDVTITGTPGSSVSTGDKVASDNLVFTITQNGTYEGGIEDGKQVGFNPVVVDVKADKSAVIKELIELRHGDAEYMFFDATSFTNESIKEYLKYDTTENANNFNYFLRPGNKTALTVIPLFDTSNGERFRYFIDYANTIKVIPEFDFRSAIDLLDAVRYTFALEEMWIKNLKANFVVSRQDYGTLLKVECLIHLIYHCRDTGSAKTLTIGSVNLAKLANVYVRLVDITDEMRAEDDLIDEKLPFEVCESTDEGAMLITEYALRKNWQIAG